MSFLETMFCDSIYHSTLSNEQIKKQLLKMRDDWDKVFKKIDKFIKDFVKKLNSSSIKPNASVTKTNAINIKKGGKNPRVDVTINCKNVGNGSEV